MSDVGCSAGVSSGQWGPCPRLPTGGALTIAVTVQMGDLRRRPEACDALFPRRFTQGGRDILFWTTNENEKSLDFRKKTNDKKDSSADAYYGFGLDVKNNSSYYDRNGLSLIVHPWALLDHSGTGLMRVFESPCKSGRRKIKERIYARKSHLLWISLKRSLSNELRRRRTLLIFIENLTEIFIRFHTVRIFENVSRWIFDRKLGWKLLVMYL